MPLEVSYFDRKTAAIMWMSVGREVFAKRTLLGEFDDHPHFPIAQGLTAYRHAFLHARSIGKPLDEQDARNAAAAYHNARSKLVSGCDEETFAPGLRDGFDYQSDVVARVFLLHHRRLVAKTKKVTNDA